MGASLCFSPLFPCRVFFFGVAFAECKMRQERECEGGFEYAIGVGQLTLFW